jgi:hypothetical protein
VSSEQHELVELQLQNEATWRVLDSATAQRDQLTRLHGGAIALLSLVFERLTTTEIVALALGISCFLAATAAMAFGHVQSLRCLQFKLGAAEGLSRRRLEAGGEPTYFGGADIPAMRPLVEQRDPMGVVTSTVRWLLLADCALIGFVLSVLIMLVVTNDPGSWSWVVASAVGCMLAGALAVASALAMARHLTKTEQDTSASIAARLG